MARSPRAACDPTCGGHTASCMRQAWMRSATQQPETKQETPAGFCHVRILVKRPLLGAGTQRNITSARRSTPKDLAYCSQAPPAQEIGSMVMCVKRLLSAIRMKGRMTLSGSSDGDTQSFMVLQGGRRYLVSICQCRSNVRVFQPLARAA